MKSLINIAASLLILGLVFYAVEKWSPSIPGQAIRRKGFGVDVMYWFFTPFITKGLTRIAMLAAVVLVAWLMGRHIGPETGPEVVRGFGPIVEQPSWLIALEMVVLGDFIGYWMYSNRR